MIIGFPLRLNVVVAKGIGLGAQYAEKGGSVLHVGNRLVNKKFGVIGVGLYKLEIFAPKFIYLVI